MTTNVGEIYYEVSADVAPLLQAQRQADKALDNMEQRASTKRIRRLTHLILVFQGSHLPSKA